MLLLFLFDRMVSLGRGFGVLLGGLQLEAWLFIRKQLVEISCPGCARGARAGELFQVGFEQLIIRQCDSNSVCGGYMENDRQMINLCDNAAKKGTTPHKRQLQK